MGNLKDDLALPGALPDSRDGAELIETHISWVLRTAGEVFKVKKPVDLGFLDFRTLAQRKRFCEAELRLNARLAPSVYRGLEPVRRDADGVHRIASDDRAGEIVDWAVRMRRLDDGERGDTLLAAGGLGGEQVAELARALAAFHASARADEETARFGAVDAIATNVRENFDQTRAAIARFLRPDEADEIERWQSAFLREHAALFEARAKGGRVRDGHGDLRLEHVYFGAGGAIAIIDCIEFNDRFRFGDVCADLAFLSMDLAWHGRVDLAERLLAEYARAANDFDLFALVDFYESYRAYVRGKVSVMLASDEGAGDLLRARAESEARRYFLLALAADRAPLVAPTLVAVGGIIASGKSTVADAIAAELGAPVVDADRTRKHMIGVQPLHPVHEEAWRGAYDPAFTEQVYAEVLRRADVVLRSGRPVVVDASFRSPGMRAAARDLAAARGVPFRMVECRIDPTACRARLEARARSAAVTDGRLAIFDAFVARFEPMNELPPAEHLVLDTARPLDESLAALRRELATWPRGLSA